MLKTLYIGLLILKLILFIHFSWGAGWGMNGYINIARGKNMCGIASFAFEPL